MPGEENDPSDVRERFARRRADADREAERAFVGSKLEMIRAHPTLSEEEKLTAIAELEEKLRGRRT